MDGSHSIPGPVVRDERAPPSAPVPAPGWCRPGGAPWCCSDWATVRPRGKKGRQEGGPQGASDDCNADRRRGEACQDKCQCQGAFRCSARRLEDQRAEVLGRTRIRIQIKKCVAWGRATAATTTTTAGAAGRCRAISGRCRVREGDQLCCGTGLSPRGVHRQRGLSAGHRDQSPCGPAACGQTDFGLVRPIRVLTTGEGGLVCVGEVFDTDIFRPLARRAPTAPRTRCVSPFSGPARSVCFPVCGPPS